MKTIIMIISILSAFMFYYRMNRSNKLVEELRLEKSELEGKYYQLKSDYNSTYNLYKRILEKDSIERFSEGK